MENYVTEARFDTFVMEMREFKNEMREFKDEVNAKFTGLLEAIGYFASRTESRLDRIEATMATKSDLERTAYELKSEIHSAIRQHERVMHT